MGEGGPSGSLDLVAARVLRAIGDIGGDRVGEQRGVLRHERKAGAKRVERDLVDAKSVDLDLAAIGVIEAKKQREDRRLARARRPHKRNALARRDTES